MVAIKLVASLGCAEVTGRINALELPAVMPAVLNVLLVAKRCCTDKEPSKAVVSMQARLVPFTVTLNVLMLPRDAPVAGKPLMLLLGEVKLIVLLDKFAPVILNEAVGTAS